MATKDLTADWKKHYKEHLVSLGDAAKTIKSGDTVWMGCIDGAVMSVSWYG